MNAEIERMIEEEDEGWLAFHALLHRVPPSRIEEPRVTPEGWSAKDVMFHVGAWLAEASRQLERIREGTYEPPAASTQTLNDEWFALSRTLDPATVWAELEASRVDGPRLPGRARYGDAARPRMVRGIRCAALRRAHREPRPVARSLSGSVGGRG